MNVHDPGSFPPAQPRLSRGCSSCRGLFLLCCLVLSLYFSTCCCLSSEPGSLFACQWTFLRSFLYVTQTKICFPRKVRAMSWWEWALGWQTGCGSVCAWSELCLAHVCKCSQHGFFCCALFRLNSVFLCIFPNAVLTALLTAGIVILSQTSRPLAFVVTWKLHVMWTVTSITALEYGG